MAKIRKTQYELPLKADVGLGNVENVLAPARLIGVLAADQVVTNSTTPVPATGMSVNLDANTTYHFELRLFLSTGTGTSTGGFKARVSGPAGATGLWGVSGQTGVALGSELQLLPSGVAPVTNVPITLFGHVSVGATAGSLAYAFALQVAASLDNTTTLAGSYIVAITSAGPVASVNNLIGATSITAAGISAQPVDADLTSIAGLDSATAGAIASDGAGWIKKTYAQLKTSLALVKADVGLGSVDNISAANLRDRSTHIGTQLIGTIDGLSTALNGKQPIDSDLTAIAALAPADGSLLRRIAGAWSSSTIAEVKTDLALTKTDVGLANVDNTSDSAKPVSTAQQTALDLKQSLSARAAANGYASLDATTKVPYAQLPTGTAAGTTVADGGHTHAAPTTGVGAVLFARCTANTVRNNSTTLTSITGLSLTLEANAVYTVDGFIAYTSTDAADIGLGFSAGTTGLAGAVTWSSVPSASTASAGTFNANAPSPTGGMAGAGGNGSTPVAALPKGFVTTTAAGAITIQVSQIVATAVNTTILANSWVRLTRIV